MLTLEQMFEMQKELDAKIVREKGLEDYDRLPDLILALQVELGETANEWRGFKYWSTDKAPRTERLLEEYVDCLHFMLSIGIICKFDKVFDKEDLWEGAIYSGSVRAAFSYMFDRLSWMGNGPAEYQYEILFNAFSGLAFALGFDFETIAEAYAKKNAINHDRQANGY